MRTESYLMHHGIKGMKWGVRRFEDASGHLTPAGKRRYGVQAARKYYKVNRLQRYREKTNNEKVKKLLDGEIRRVKTREDRKVADLSKRDINIGRQIVAKNRRNLAVSNTVAKAGATAAVTAILYSNPKTRWAAPLAATAGAAATMGSAKKVPYYTMEARRYKQVNPKGGTNKGLTDKQIRARKIAKGAATAAGVAGMAALGVYTAKKVSENKAQANKLGGASEATRAIINANHATSQSRQRAQAASTAKTVAGKAASSVGSAAKKTASSGKQAVGNAVKSRVTSTINPNDPRTWTSTARQTHEDVSTAIDRGYRAYQTVQAVRNRDALTAIASVTPELIEGTNKLIETSQSIRSKFSRS